MTKDQRLRLLDFCQDIVEWGDRIPRLIDGRSFEEFAQDEAIYLSVWKCVEVLGEAAGSMMRVDPTVDERFPDLQLRAAYAMRNQLVHGYGTVDVRILWVTVRDFVPGMVSSARGLIENEQGQQ